jgi:hypothetical protein
MTARWPLPRVGAWIGLGIWSTAVAATVGDWRAVFIAPAAYVLGRIDGALLGLFRRA